VGRFERDSPLQFAFGCSWAFFIGGAIATYLAPPTGIWVLVGAAGIWYIGYRAARTSVGRSVRLFAENKCLFCEYDLIGLGLSGKCPECGQKFERAGPTADLSP
jgi:hypothetical protein